MPVVINILRVYVLGVFVCLSCFAFQYLNCKNSYIEEFAGVTLNTFFISILNQFKKLHSESNLK